MAKVRIEEKISIKIDSSLALKKFVSTLHNIEHIVEKEKSECVELSLFCYDVGSRSHEENL